MTMDRTNDFTVNVIGMRQTAAVQQLAAIKAVREGSRGMRRAAVVEAWNSGIRSMSAIAQVLGVSRDTVTRDLADAGLRPLKLLAPTAR